jgi:hypothetical protein
MIQKENFTRRQFLKATAAGGAICTLTALAGNSAFENIGPTSQVTSIGGVPTFVCDDKALLKPAFETYVPTQHYFKQFAEAGTRIFVLHGYGDRPETSLDLFVLSMENLGEPKVILETESTEWAPSLSPDGRWIAYSSNRGGGNFQIYVQPYPEMDQLIPISKESGELPIWSRNGEELFYRNKNKWMVVSISTEPEFVAGTPEVLFEGPYGQVPGLSYDVTLDGQRLMVLLPEYDDSQVREFCVVTNWFEGLKWRLPLLEKY